MHHPTSRRYAACGTEDVVKKKKGRTRMVVLKEWVGQACICHQTYVINAAGRHYKCYDTMLQINIKVFFFCPHATTWD
jgi:hypothetical protein